ncbi:NAD(P)/FAD-dependent oxidoreductase, partial [Rhizobium leguminosarum]|uniref:NAD(P)/FAD-dependent oxidoreductase n=1 Tax=Rhizobium leguminosarum TaxID=384 RepID=UPI003F96C1E8
LSFPGGALIGCSAGLVNVPRIKGSHNAVLSGMLAAEKIAAAIISGRSHDEVTEIETEWRKGDIGKDLKRVRNVKPLWSKFGTALGVALGGSMPLAAALIGIMLFRERPDSTC